ncbi:MAG: IclR family transcriptional regulator [Lachnospiraceae bacterium]|jgi:DNA-binding IclR family transcriptional regulator|nr:IclR family transcriptional regulator [Lachnospiraceae bacterium]
MIQSLLRSMELLEVLKEKNGSFSIAELAETMDLPPSTVHRILQTFCDKKYVIRDERAHTYRLGPALIPLGRAAARGIRLQDAAGPILTALTVETKEDSYLIIPVGSKGLVIEKVDGPSHLKVVEEFGYEMYLHCGAIRKVLLAWQTPSFIEDYLNTIVLHDRAFPETQPDVLRKELTQIRKDGFAITRGEYVNDAVGIGAPIFNSSGLLAGSIGIIAPKVRIESDAHLFTQRRLVQHYAAELSADLGYEGIRDT